MELWIRSQDRKCLIKAKIIRWEDSCLRGATDDDGWYYDLGKYKKERALEVLDEIQNIIENKFLVKCHPLMRKEDLEIAKLQIEELNNIKCIMSEDRFEIEPINKECIIYEMPKE